MKQSQKISLRQVEVRRKISDMLDTEVETRSDTFQADLDTFKNELRALDSELEAALMVESDEAETRQVESVETPEGREYAALIEQSSVADFVTEALGGGAVQGASLELRQEILGDNVPVSDGIWMPLDLLFDSDGGDLETRADAATNVASAIQDSQQPITPRLFPASAGAFMGIQRPTVPVGDTTYIAITGGATADFRSDGVGKDAEAATFTTKTVNPARVTARYLLGVETTARVKGIEEALRADLNAVMADKLDKVALTGQAAVANVSPAIEGLIAQLTDPDNPATVASWSDYYGIYAGRVDGKYSANGSNVRVLVNAETFRHAAGLQVATSGDLLIDRLPSGRFRASANMPATASSIATALSYASGRRGFVQPVWRGVQIIRDVYTRAAEGQVALTIAMLTGAAMVDSGPYGRHEFKVA